MPQTEELDEVPPKEKFHSIAGFHLGNQESEVHLQGKIPLFLPRPAINLDRISEAEAQLLNLVKKSKILIPRHNLHVIRRSIITALYIWPELDIFDKQVQFTTTIFIALYYLDVEIISSLFFATINEAENFIIDGLGLIIDIWKGKYTSIDQLPKTPAVLKPILYFFINLNQECGESFLEADIDTSKVLKSMINCVHSTMALRTYGIRYYCSVNGLGRSLHGQESLGQVTMELFSTMEGLNSKIRKHILYKELIHLISLEAAYVADVFGFVDYLESEETLKINLIKRKAELEDISYQESFNQAVKFIESLRIDIIIVTEQLIKEFPGDKSLGTCIEFCKRVMDATIHIYTAEEGKKEELITAEQ